MSDTEIMAARIRERIIFDPRVTERKMFGGVGFMLDDHMALGVTNKGELMARIGKDNDAAARALPGAERVDFQAKRMGGFLIISPEAIEQDAHLAGWIDLAMAFTATLPPK